MSTPSEIITTVAALMNDASQNEYTNSACLPYFNLALNGLQEIFELNDIPVTHVSSSTIIIPDGTSEIGFATTPSLPSTLIEIAQLWESPAGQEQWTPMIKKEFIPHYLQDGIEISQFLIWAWKGQKIEVIPANVDINLKIDYIGSIFATPITMAFIDVDLAVLNTTTYLMYKTAALCAMFIAENETRAMALNGEAGMAIDRSLGISVKGMQSIVTRRRPFRATFKHRGVMI